MPYYHIYAEWEDEVGSRCGANVNFSEEQIKDLSVKIKKGLPFLLKNFKLNPYGITKLEIWRTTHIAIMSKKWDWIRATGKDVTHNFVISLPVPQTEGKKVFTTSSKETKKVRSKDIFIVHGRDHEPMKELKTMLSEFGLNPIVLHEQPNRGRTLIEKLEKVSQHTEYAFIILTPDDVGGHREDLRKKLGASKHWTKRPVVMISPNIIDDILEDFEPRARQNVILEMGFFWGLLKRENVCFLVKEKVTEPSDIRGIGYTSFKTSVKEARSQIIKELKAANYEIKS